MKDNRVDELARRYSAEARAYRDLWAPVLLPLARRALREVAGVPIERAVDIGTGVGTLLPELGSALPGALVLGVDRSPGMLALASWAGPLALMDAMDLGLGSRSVDLVLMAFVLFHLPDPLGALIEAHRVLRSGGRVLTVTWGSDFESRATQIWDEELVSHGAAPLELEGGLTRHEAVDSPEKMTALLGAAGFGSVRAWSENCDHIIDAEHLIHLRTSLGRSRPRYEGMDFERRASCLANARRRLKALPPDGFVTRGVVVYATGEIGDHGLVRRR